MKDHIIPFLMGFAVALLLTIVLVKLRVVHLCPDMQDSILENSYTPIVVSNKDNIMISY